MVKQLLDNNVDIGDALSFACEKGHMEIATLLLACRIGHTEIVWLLLNSGADANAVCVNAGRKVS